MGLRPDHPNPAYGIHRLSVRGAAAAYFLRVVPAHGGPQRQRSRRLAILRALDRDARAPAASGIGPFVSALPHGRAHVRARGRLVVRVIGYLALVQTLVAVALAPGLTGFIRWLK